MTRTQFCDSSGLHTLIAAHKRAEAEGREVLLVIPSTTVLRVFALTGIDHVIPNFTSLTEALRKRAATVNPAPPRLDDTRGRRKQQAVAAPAPCSGLDR